MIKVISKDGNEKGVNVKYKSVMSNTFEHIAVMCSIYKEIKANTDLSDEEIFSFIVEYSKREGGEE